MLQKTIASIESGVPIDRTINGGLFSYGFINEQTTTDLAIATAALNEEQTRLVLSSINSANAQEKLSKAEIDSVIAKKADIAAAHELNAVDVESILAKNNLTLADIGLSTSEGVLTKEINENIGEK